MIKSCREENCYVKNENFEFKYVEMPGYVTYVVRSFVGDNHSEKSMDDHCRENGFPFHQNVMFTLLLGLMSIDALEKMKQNRSGKVIVVTVLKIMLYLLIGTIGFVDYGMTGILTILAFYLFRNFKFAWIGQFVSLLFLFVIFFKGQSIVIPLFGMEYFFPIQGFGILALIPIWLYNGKLGKKNRVIQYGFYLFYPVHMLLLYVIYRFAF